MPDDFEYPLVTEVWTPLALTPEEKSRRDLADLHVMGRLKPGMPIGQAREEITALNAELQRRYPKTNLGHGVIIKPLRETMDEVTDRFTLILLGAATFVLLLACANVANLQLARSTARQREIGLRAALGASRFRIARELLTESIVIGVLGGIVGMLLANWDLTVTKAAIPAQVFQWVAGLRKMHMDASVIAFGFAVSVAAGVICSLPAIYQLLRQHDRAGLNDVLKEGGRASTSGTSRSRARSTLVVVEVALSLVLLVGAGLLVRTFQRILALNLGYDPKNVLIADVWLSANNYRDDPAMARFFDQVLAGVRTLPGVETAASEGDVGGASTFRIEGQPELQPGEPRPYVSAISADYFRTLRIPVLAGRSIGTQDGANAPGVAVVSEAVVKHYWPRVNPIGRRIQLRPNSPWLTIAGVCGDRKDWFSAEPQPAAYVSYQQWPTPYMRLFTRTTRDPMQSASAVRMQVRRVDPNQPVYGVKTEETALAEETSGVRMAAARMSMYAAISLLLAVMGCYAVGAFSVARRTQEIGIRMTLGATRGNILGMVLSQTARMTAIGLAAGLTLAIAMTVVMSHALFNVVAVEPLTFVVLTAVLAGAALLAGYIPAYRAARIDPMTALRNE